MFTRPRTLAGVVLVTITLLSGVTACVPPSGALDCHGAVDAYWPASAQPRAHKVVTRESGGDPTAQNRRSTAAGCFQLLRVHRARFARLGYSWDRDRYLAVPNVRVALDLWHEQGWRPWQLTA